jgi:GTP cyclohydrolase IA
VAGMYQEVFSGLHEDPLEYFDTIFSEEHEEVVL